MAHNSLKRRKLSHDEGSLAAEQDEHLDVIDSQGLEQSLLPTASLRLLEHSGTSRSSRGVVQTGLKVPYTGDNYNSSLFQLQVSEMLLEVKPNYAKITMPVDAALRKLKNLIESIETREPLSIAEASKLMRKTHKIEIPFPEPKPDEKAAYKLSYSKPSNINVAGSYVLQTMTKGDHTLAVDLILSLPASILQEKDYLDYRYFYKRAYFLACVAAGLQENTENEFSLHFEYLGDNSLQPILTLEPLKFSAESDLSNFSYRIHIIPAAPEGFFTDKKLQPTKNAIRLKTAPNDPSKSYVPTPFYNSTIRVDSTFAQYLKLLHLTSKRVDGFKDACVLGRIWLNQRGFRGSLSSGGFGHFEWAVLGALLLQGGGSKGRNVLSPDYNGYQLFKATIQYLSITDLVANPVMFQTAELALPMMGNPIFYDGPRSHNLLFKMTPWSCAMLHDEAQISNQMLNDATFDRFEATFIIKKESLLQQFDSLFKTPIPKAKEENTPKDHRNEISKFTSSVYAILKEGLNDRVRAIQIMEPSYSSWSLNSLAQFNSTEISVGVIFDPMNVNRVIDRGPPADDKGAASNFRKLWGDKAELRRFNDGSILESLVWTSTSENSVFREIVHHLLERHFGPEIDGEVTFLSHETSQLLSNSDNSSVKAFRNLMADFNTLEHDLKNMDGLPLQLKLLSAIDPQLRMTSIEPPNFTPNRQLREPAGVLVQLEGSGRWPDDIAAIQRTKIAFLLKIGSLLESSVNGLIIRLGIENRNQSLRNCAYLDVQYPSGAAFRLRIYIDREQFLLERHVKDQKVAAQFREDFISARSLNNYMNVQLPLHSQSVATYCTRFPMLSSTIRLVKKWFYSHLLADHVREELIELIVLHSFLQPYPWRAPSSLMTGFLRTLHFIARWDWRAVPLIIDFSGTMTSKDVTGINTRLTAWRKIDPGMNRVVIFAASNHDITGTAFTDGGPSKVVAARMTTLARSAWLIAKDKPMDLDPNKLFKSSKLDYDFIIHISPKLTSILRSKTDGKPAQFKNLEAHNNKDMSVTSYEPLELFLSEIRGLYLTSVLFFFNPLAKSFIGGLWNPQTSSRTFKINLPYATKPLAEGATENQDQSVEIDKAGILSDIARLGGDMVDRIERHH